MLSDNQSYGPSGENSSPQYAGAAVHAAMDGMQPDDGDANSGKGTGEGSPDESHSTGERGSNQGDNSKSSDRPAQGGVDKAGAGMQDYAGSLPQDSQGHLNSAMGSAKSAVSVIYSFFLSLLFGWVSAISIEKPATVIY